MIKSGKMRWVGPIARVWRKVLLESLKEILLGRPGHRLEVDVKMYTKQIGWRVCGVD
jgi:hypothetical protein